jgi:hypothetical protein
LEKLIPFLIVLKDDSVSVGRWIQVHSSFVTAAATFIIAAFTWALWWATRKLGKISQEQARDLKDSIAVAQRAADAAEKSANVLPAIERAYVFSNIKLDREIKIGDEEFNAVLYLKNHGKTPAIIKEIGFMGYSPNTQSRPLHIHHPVDSILGSGDEFEENSYWFAIKESDWDELITTKPQIKFFCIGYVKYMTVFGEEDWHAFYWEFYTPYNRFVLVQSEELNHDT